MTVFQKWIVGIATTLLIGWVAWVSTMLISVDQRLAIREGDSSPKLVDLANRVSVIESNRFTSGDAIKLTPRDTTAALADSIARHQVLPGHAVLEERVASIREQLTRIEIKTENLDASVRRLASKVDSVAANLVQKGVID